MKAKRIIPVCQLGALEEKEITSYYCFYPQVTAPTRIEMAAACHPLVTLLLADMESSCIKIPSLDRLENLPEVRGARLHIIPVKKGETFSQAKSRVSNAPPAVKFGYVDQGKMIWLGSPTPLPEIYSKPSALYSNWNDALVQSPFLRFVTVYGTLPVTTPREVISCEFIPPDVALTPSTVTYKNGNGKFDHQFAVKKIAEKVSLRRGFTFEYTNGLSVPLFVKDFLDGKLSEQSITFPQLGQQYFIEASQDLHLGHQIADMFSTNNQIHDDYLRDLAVRINDIYLAKMNGINGFGVFAKNRITKGTPLGLYSGEFFDHIDPIDEAIKHSFLLRLESAITWSNNLATFSYKKGNFIEFINHGKTAKCNVSATVRLYKGLLLCVYVAENDIEQDHQLLIDYSGVYPEQDNNLEFTKSGGIVWTKAACAAAVAVSTQGAVFFKAEKFQEAKRKFKQAVALTENAPSKQEEKSTSLYNLGSTYMRLEPKEKHNERARFFLKAAQACPKYEKHEGLVAKLQKVSLEESKGSNLNK